MFRWLCFFGFLVQISCWSEEAPKIICVTVPKAGTHLLTKAIQLMTGYKAHWINANVLTNLAGNNILCHPDKKCFVLHILSSLGDIRALDSHKFKKILIVRDPRDALISFFYHIFNKKPWPFGGNFHLKNGSLEELIQKILQHPERTVIEAFNFTREWMLDPSVLVVRFEDLVGEQGGGDRNTQLKTLAGIARFINYPMSSSQIEKVSANLFGASVTFRKGQIGSWKTFPYEDRELFKSRIEQAVIQLGYEEDNNW